MTVYFRRTCGDHSSLHFNGTDLQKVKSCYKKYLGVPCTSQVTRPWHLTPSAYLERRTFWAFSLPAEELNSLFRSHHLLQGDNREHPDKLFHCLVWQLHHFGLQDPTAYHKDSWTDYCCFFIPTTETSSVAPERLLALCWPSHSSHELFTFLRFGVRCGRICAATTRLCNSFSQLNTLLPYNTNLT